MVNVPKVTHLLDYGACLIKTARTIQMVNNKSRPPYRLMLDNPNPSVAIQLIYFREAPKKGEKIGRPAAFHTAEEALTFKRLCLEKLDRHLLKKNSNVHTHGRSKVLGTKTRH